MTFKYFAKYWDCNSLVSGWFWTSILDYCRTDLFVRYYLLIIETLITRSTICKILSRLAVAARIYFKIIRFQSPFLVFVEIVNIYSIPVVFVSLNIKCSEFIKFKRFQREQQFFPEKVNIHRSIFRYIDHVRSKLFHSVMSRRESLRYTFVTWWHWHWQILSPRLWMFFVSDLVNK